MVRIHIIELRMLLIPFNELGSESPKELRGIFYLKRTQK
jgi:hypothetical protein